MTQIKNFRNWRPESVNNAPLIAFRILFGALMTIEAYGVFLTGWLKRVYLDPHITFTMFTVEWPYTSLGHWATPWFVCMGFAAIAVMLGWRYRIASVLLSIFWTASYVCQKSSYNNHYYLMVLVCWAMVFLPAHQRLALDAGRRVLWSNQCPRWVVQAFQLQLAIVFSYAAIAKVHDGWLSGDFLKIIFSYRADIPILGPFINQSWFPQTLAISGLFFDALIVPMLLWRRTRTLAMFGMLLFNLFNSIVLRIGIFPYMVLAWTIFFWEAKTLEKIFTWIRGQLNRAPPSSISNLKPSILRSQAPKFILNVYFLIQIILPLRHHVIPGDAAWSDEGHRMSWRMMLRVKSGTVKLEARDSKTQRRWIIDQSKWLSPKQQRRVATTPDILYQFVQALKNHYRQQGITNLELYAVKSRVRLNGHRPVPMFDPNVNLTQVNFYYFKHNSWILMPHPN